VLARPILALVREPIIGRGVDSLAFVSLEQLFHIRNPHRSADDLSDARHEQVATLREGNARRFLLLHVEGLEPGGEAVQEDGRADGVRHVSLRRLCDVVADGVWHHLGLSLRVHDYVALRVFGLVLDPVLVQPGYSVDVGEAHEWARGWCEGGVELLDQRRGGLVLPELVHGFANLFFFGLDVSAMEQRGVKSELTTASTWSIRSSNVMNASSASTCVYSLRCRRV
jgi:hypothetical protein